ncbi:TLD family protein [Trichomonas vaginalis G3]|uniref:TLD family protein n=1 Tax=Trichomonas vaginalis (strain ATCC PRA-98 / G3) TaxID=412133 RepID=A2E8E4_TRIV3|nr:TLD family protein [Trichomonas vaginalis G3]|eukprot:XP_001323295.1 TLD family protein [Trichomonas vaginalis G3]
MVKQLMKEAGDVYGNSLAFAKRQLKDHITCEHSLEELFGVSPYIIKFLPEKMKPLVKDFLTALWATNKGIEYSPLLPATAVILLLFMEPPAAYASLQAMINRSQEDCWYFTMDRKNYHKNVIAIEKSIIKKAPDVAKKANELGVNIAFLTLGLIPAFFLPFSPLPVALTFFDSFIVEGRKVLIRFITTIFKHNSVALLKCKTSKEFATILLTDMDGFTNPNHLRNFLGECFKIYMSRRKHPFDLHKIPSSDVKKIAEMNSNAMMMAHVLRDHMPEDYNPLDFPRKDNLTVITELTSTITPEEIRKYQTDVQKKLVDIQEVHGGKLLDNNNYYKLKEFIPLIYLRKSPALIYSLSKDGTMLSTLIEKTRRKGAHILMIKTEKSIIGAFLSDQIENTSGRFYGNASTFVFHIGDTMNCYKHSHPPNKNYISVDDDTMILGGPNPAIIVSDGFENVRSCECDTFGSPQLTIDASEKILDIELYIFEQ